MVTMSQKSSLLQVASSVSLALTPDREGDNAMLSTILIVLLILLLIGALPTWPYSASWGYGPGGLLGTVLVVVLILALLGRV
jgi:hypothetical protein